MDKNLTEVLETVNFIKDHMLMKEDAVTKDDLPKLIRPIFRTELKPIEDRLTAVESKVAGTNRRLDTEAMYRDDLEMPQRVSDLETKTFGASRHPKHIPLK